LSAAAQVSADDVILDPVAARRAGMSGTLVFPVGNIAPQGAVIKATAIDVSVVDADGVFRQRGPARVFTDEAAAIRALKGGDAPIKPGDVIVLIGNGPAGTGMQETAQITTALRYLPWGKHVALITDGRFSGLSTGACVGHVGPEALAGGAIGRVRDGDIIEIIVDRGALTASINVVDSAAGELAQRAPHPDLRPHDHLPDDTRLWAALQRVSGGTWGGCVYDVAAISRALGLE
jgi:dihydroxyacid dehydratase/phosphogluconate dehydratase